MRDPERIRRFCDELAAIWQNECPDWRFGQFIVNVFGNSDPFYLEEDAAMNEKPARNPLFLNMGSRAARTNAC